MDKELKVLISEYAEVYKKFEHLQKNTSLLAGGDQKTGVIAEYYAKLYIEKTYNVNAEYASPGTSYDIAYTMSGKLIRVQVKGVSAHSKTRTIAPLNLKDKNGDNAFDELYLIDLDESFLPKAFYINTFSSISKKINDRERNRIVGSTMRDSAEGGRQGSAIYDFTCNKIDELNKIIQ